RGCRDTRELIQSTTRAAPAPLPTLAGLDRIAPSLPLRKRLVAMTAVLQQRLHTAFSLAIALGMSAPPEEVESRRRTARLAQAGIVDRVIRLLEPDRDRFRCPLPEVVRMLRLVTFAGSHPMITDNQPLSPDQIVDLLLNGTLRRDGAGPGPAGDTINQREGHSC